MLIQLILFPSYQFSLRETYNHDLIIYLYRVLIYLSAQIPTLIDMNGEFKHEVRQFQKPYDNQQAEQISLMV
ncbi:hypothetical protein F969_01154 [Acinetobacter variabilis]|uniref:Uncharacterized protein n=1 Tax=Acinetobacter variabilis TaxID=70346 RepID=N8VJY0_9GAMM|nr:hypothetical protein F969_01154 [Acinetobacter variabilis]